MSQTENSGISSQRTLLGAFLGIAIITLVISLLGAASEPDHFFNLYLFAFIFWLHLALGCMGWLLLTSLFDAPWTYAIRRIAGAGARTLPLLALASIPLLVSQDRIFPWAMEGAELKDAKEIYLDQNFFALRTIIYFAIWIPLVFVLTQQDYASDKTEGGGPNKSLAVFGVVMYFITGTFAAFDWVLSLDYESFSSIFGWLMMSQQMFMAFTFFMIVLAFLWRQEPLSKVTQPRIMSDLSALLLVAMLVWGYLNVMQYVIMWSGNIPDKVNLYVIRTEGAWEAMAILLVLMHTIAFFLLVMPNVRRMRTALFVVAILLFVARFFEFLWLALPPFQPEELVFYGWDYSMWFAIGGFWVAAFLWLYNSQPILPENDAAIQKYLSTEEHERYHTDGSIVRSSV